MGKCQLSTRAARAFSNPSSCNCNEHSRWYHPGPLLTARTWVRSWGAEVCLVRKTRQLFCSAMVNRPSTGQPPPSTNAWSLLNLSPLTCQECSWHPVGKASQGCMCMWSCSSKQTTHLGSHDGAGIWGDESWFLPLPAPQLRVLTFNKVKKSRGQRLTDLLKAPQLITVLIKQLVQDLAQSRGSEKVNSYF